MPGNVSTRPNPVVLQDGADPLRTILNPLVALKLDYPDRGTIIVTLTIPDPFPLWPSARTKAGMKTTFTRHFDYAPNSMQWWDAARGTTVPITVNEWRLKIEETAANMLAKAQTDPVEFFEYNSVDDERSR